MGIAVPAGVAGPGSQGTGGCSTVGHVPEQQEILRSSAGMLGPAGQTHSNPKEAGLLTAQNLQEWRSGSPAWQRATGQDGCRGRREWFGTGRGKESKGHPLRWDRRNKDMVLGVFSPPPAPTPSAAGV